MRKTVLFKNFNLQFLKDKDLTEYFLIQNSLLVNNQNFDMKHQTDKIQSFAEITQKSIKNLFKLIKKK